MRRLSDAPTEHSPALSAMPWPAALLATMAVPATAAQQVPLRGQASPSTDRAAALDK